MGADATTGAPKTRLRCCALHTRSTRDRVPLNHSHHSRQGSHSSQRLQLPPLVPPACTSHHKSDSNSLCAASLHALPSCPFRRCAVRLEEAAAASRRTEAELQSRVDEMHAQLTRMRSDALMTESELQVGG